MKSKRQAFHTRATTKLTQDLRGYCIAKEAWSNAVTKRNEDKKTLPFSEDNVHLSQPLYYFDMFPLIILSCNGLDALKQLARELDRAVDLIDKTLAFMRSAAMDVINHVDRYDRRVMHDKKALEKKKARSSAAKTAQPGAHAAVVESVGDDEALLNIVNDCVMEMMTFDSPDKVDEARVDGTLDGSVPHTVKNCREVQNFADAREFQSSLGIFRIQYPSSAQAKKDAKGWTPCHQPQKESMLAALQKLGPKTIAVSAGETNSMFGKAMNQLHLYAISANYKGIGLERQGVPGYKYQLAGSREVAVISWTHLINFANKLNSEKPEDKNVFEWMVDLVKCVPKEDMLAAFTAAGGKVHKTQIQAGTMMYLPPASFVIERVLGAEPNYGIRCTSVLAGNQAFEEMYEQVKGVGESALVNFWTTYIEKAKGASNPLRRIGSFRVQGKQSER